MKIISYNLNGIRAAMKKDLVEWLQKELPDVLCLQELKALPDQFDQKPFEELGYTCYFMPAEKKGYSGVAIFTRLKPTHIEHGCSNNIYDAEGRVIRADFDDVSVMSVYMPSGTSGDIRQDFKYQWLDFFYDYAHQIREEHSNLVICGDYNIAHTEIDIHNPVSNKKSSGFLPEERAWLTKYINSGFIDTFRHFSQEPKYSWWSYRFNSRAKNLGWRIDYHMASEALSDRLVSADILTDAFHSDHCPILLEIS